MDDEIDIEEHDVLDNPAIKNIFPDLTILKKEICTYDDQASAVKTDPDIILINSQDSIDKDIICENSCSEDDDLTLVENIKIDEDVPLQETSSFEGGKLFFQNKIILGSRPTQKVTQQTHKETHYEQNIKPYSARVYVKDIGSYLENSGKFCGRCKIFFPQKQDFDNHKKDVHEKEDSNTKLLSSSVKPVMELRHKCEKCFQNFSSSSNLGKHLRNIHHLKFSRIRKPRINKNVRQNLSSASSFNINKSNCFHCKKMFPSQKSLIEHIYKVLQSSSIDQRTQLRLIESNKKLKETYRTKRKYMSNFLENKNHLGNKHHSEKRIVNKENTLKFYKCCYCSYYFRDMNSYRIHLTNKHNDKDLILVNKVVFDPHCKFCFIKQGNVHKYNCHLLYRHAEMVNKTFKLQPKLCLTRIEFILAGKQRPTIAQYDKLSNLKQSQEQLQCYNEDEDNTSAMKSKEEVKLPRKCKIPTKHVTPIKKVKIDEDIVHTYEESNYSIEIEQNDLVLKGILFKCKRCDIHFLTSRCAINHSEHMEMLINWKCLICLKIFKKHDEYLHNQQHALSDEFVVYELSESKLSRVLYKCPKCAIHFNDEKYAFHFKMCGKIVTESTYCNACDILLEKSAMSSHEYEHKTNNYSLADFTIVTSDVIIDNNTTAEKNVKKDIKTLKKRMKPMRKATLKNKMKPQRKEHKPLDMLKLSYCDTCKCFIINSFLRTVHLEGRCLHIAKHVCKYCGLLLTNKSIQSHRLRHEEEKDLKLQNFKFYDLKSNKRILPPIPDYPKCTNCDVCFLTKMDITTHVCNENEYLTCPICDIKLSDEVFKLHLAFHHYSLEQSNHNFFGNTLLNGPELVKSDGKCFSPDTVIKSTGESENVDVQCIDKLENDTKESSKNNQVIQNEQVNLLENNKPAILKSETASTAEKCTKKYASESVKSRWIERKTDLELYGVVYCCSYCYLTLVTFDQAVEHCQDHHFGVEMGKGIVKCSVCKMNYSERHCVDHQKIHDVQKSEKTLNILNFDAVYFAVDYKLWTQKLFESSKPEVTQSILDRSIYKYEGRIKLKIIQKGHSDITVYKCNACRMFVDPDDILSHTENSCFRLKKNICSFCGLAFVSHVFRMSHEQVHQHNTDLTVNSFVIVVFNRDVDKEYNKNVINSRNDFIFFQCRNCKGLFERFESRVHDCKTINFKQCSICGFLIYKSRYNSHMMKHTLILNLTHNNMRIIRFGKGDGSNSASSGMPVKFSGVVRDYAFYKCLRCELHIKKSQSETIKHDCSDDSAKTVCSKCNLSFLKKQINQHNKLHDSDPYFVKDNFNLLLIKETDMECLNSLTEVHINKKSNIKENVSNKEKSLDENNTSPTIEKVAKIYKCKCSLSFLDKLGIKSHLGHCKAKIVRQTCNKCSLVFTPKDLFTHLLKHHGDKKYLYKFDIIQMNKNKSKIIELYSCSICKIHFVEYEKAKEHFHDCLNSMSEGNKCDHCKLLFDKTCIEFHKTNHHGSDVVDFDIIDVKEESNNSHDNSSMEKEIQNITSEADAVLERNYKISEEALSQISLNNYSNTIYKCIECNIHFLTEHTFIRHLRKDGHGTYSTIQKNCELCGLNFSLQSLTKHIYVHHDQMNLELPNIIIKSSIDESND